MSRVRIPDDLSSTWPGRVVQRSYERAAQWYWSRRGGGDPRSRTWPDITFRARVGARRHRQLHECNICGWQGPAFLGYQHSESADCPVCGSVARDRFLYWCWVRMTPFDRNAKVLETSPRLGDTYRSRMGQHVRYVSSDYDGSAHRGVIRLDLQDIALPDDDLDVVLTPHVLEHVPDTGRALSELYRVLKPGGSILLQVPIPQARTGVPSSPEYHGDNTLVHHRFGWDLLETIRGAGFTCELLVTQELHDAARAGRRFDYHGADVDAEDLMSGADARAMTVVADEADAERYSFLPALHFISFHARKPSASPVTGL